MGLKVTGNPGRLLSEQGRSHHWAKSGMVKRKSYFRVLVQAGCFAAIGMGGTNSEAVSNGKDKLFRAQKDFTSRTPVNLGPHEAKILCGSVHNVLPQIRPKLVERLRLEKSFNRIDENFRDSFRDGEKVYRFGSLVSGLSLPGSDLDICLLRFAQQVPNRKKYMSRSIQILHRLGFKNLVPIPHATVPIIKFEHPQWAVKGDLSFGDEHGIINSYFLKAYTELTPHFRDLVLLVKAWAKKREVSDASQGYISSYGWTLLVLFYLQTAQVAPVLDLYPVGRALDVRRQSPELDLFTWLTKEFKNNVFEHKPLEDNPTLDVLVDGFFDYYARRSPLGSSVISTRLGRLVKQDQSRCFKPQRPAFLHLEDPLQDEINVSRHVRERTIQKLLAEIRRAHEIIRSSGDFFKVIDPSPDAMPPSMPDSFLDASRGAGGDYDDEIV